MGRYFVLAPGGVAHGPEDVQTLAAWAAEGGIQPTTVLRHSQTGQVAQASSVQGVFPPQQIVLNGSSRQAPFPRKSTLGAYPNGQTDLCGLPPEVAERFSWGAFFLTYPWALQHKKFILLLIPLILFLIQIRTPLGFLCPAVALVSAVYTGIKGNLWAWQSGLYTSVQELEDSQRKWASAGFKSLAAAIILIALYLLIFVGLFSNLMANGPKWR